MGSPLPLSRSIYLSLHIYIFTHTHTHTHTHARMHIVEAGGRDETALDLKQKGSTNGVNQITKTESG